MPLAAPAQASSLAPCPRETLEAKSPGAGLGTSTSHAALKAGKDRGRLDRSWTDPTRQLSARRRSPLADADFDDSIMSWRYIDDGDFRAGPVGVSGDCEREGSARHVARFVSGCNMHGALASVIEARVVDGVHVAGHCRGSAPQIPPRDSLRFISAGRISPEHFYAHEILVWISDAACRAIGVSLHD